MARTNSKLIDDPELREIIEELCYKVSEEASDEARRTGRTVQACISSLIRPLITQEVIRTGVTNPDALDCREKEWLVGLDFARMGASGDYEIKISGNFRCSGVSEIMYAVMHKFNECHEEADQVNWTDVYEFFPSRLTKRIKSVRSAASTAKEVSRTRIKYLLPNGDAWMCTISLDREEWH